MRKIIKAIINWLIGYSEEYERGYSDATNAIMKHSANLRREVAGEYANAVNPNILGRDDYDDGWLHACEDFLSN